MPREIFGEVSNPSVKLGSQAWYTVSVSILVHAAVIAVVIVVPLVATGVLPEVPIVMAFKAPPPMPDPPLPPAPAPRTNATETQVSPDAAPREAPETISPEVAKPSMPGPPPVEGGINLPGGPGEIVGTGVNIGPPPPPAPVVAQAPLRPGGDIKIPRKILNVAPVYPAIAREAKVEGMVIIEATIGTDGRVKDTRALRSEPLLESAAIEAVKQWRFTPTLLNGVPVPILMTVTVNFKLH